MATTVAPIDIEKILLEGAEPLPETKKRLPPKPPLDEALTNYYNKTAPTGARQLAPGEVPLPTSTEVEGPPAPGIMSRLPSLPSFGVAPAADKSIAGTASPLATTPITPSAPIVSTEPLAAAKVPGATTATPTELAKPSGWYDTLQRHTGFVRDVAEAGGGLIAGAGAFAFGAATAVSDILNAQLSRVARGGPMAGGPESSTHYRDIFARMDKTITNLTPEPRSDVAKNVQKGVGAVTGLIKDVAELPGKGLVATGIMNEDTARVLSFATELYLFYRLDRGVREAAPELRSKIADFKTRMSKATSDAEVASAASGLADAAAKNPKVNDALGEARGKFRDEADREAGRGPREPQPEGPAPGGATFEFTPEELNRYTDALNKATTDFRAARPEGFTIEELRTHLDANVPKPQGTPRPAPEAPRPAEPTRVTPAGDIVLSEDLRSYVDGQLAAGMPVDQIVRNVRPSVRGDISDAQIREAVRSQTRPGPEPARDPLAERRAAASPPTERVTVDDVISGRAEPAVPPTEPIPPTAGGGTTTFRTEDLPPAPPITPDVINLRPQAQAPVAPTAAATVAPETVPAPVSPETSAVAATPTIRLYRTDIPAEQRPASTDPSQSHVASRHLNYIRDWRDANAPGADIYYIDVPFDPSNPMTPEPPESITPQQRTQLKLLPEAAAAIPSETITPPVSPGGTVAAARSLLEEGKLAELKQLAMEESGRSTADGLKKLGFTPEEINTLKPQLNKIRAKKATAAKPAVQTAATEAVLESMPAGTEVEIPRPADPVVDSSPVIEKPKRARRVVKAPAPPAEPITRTEPGGTFRTKVDLVPGATDDVHAFLLREGDATATAISRRAGYNIAESNEIIRRLVAEGRVQPVQVGDYTRYHAVTQQVPTSGPPLFATINMLPELETSIRGTTTLMPGITTPAATPIQVRTIGRKPDAVFVDTARMNTRTSLADIDAQVTRGRMSADVGEMMKANLQRQADIAGLPITEAHQFTGEELMREATRVAAENDLDLYVKKGKNYELVPKDVVRTDTRLNRGDDLAATPISRDAAGAYVESKTSDIGPDAIRGILEAIERGIDVTERLPSELVPHYKQMRETERAGIDTSERRAFIDMLTDFNIMLGEEGSIGGSFNRAQRMAAQRLQADMRKAGKTVREFLFGARPEDVAMFESYLETINNPVPVNSTNPRNMRFDPENIIPGDKIVKQRNVSKAQGLDAVPLWQSEVRGIQNARDIKAGGTTWDMLSPLRQHKAAGTEFIYYAYRTSQKNLNAEITTLQKDMTELGRGFSSRSLENIGANGYARQGTDGQRILTYNKVTPQPLTLAERKLQSTIDGLYRVTEVRLNEARAATGREPLDHINDYQTFARTFNILGSLGIKIDLTRATNAEINAAYIKHRTTNFPYLVRKHAAYSAEMNVLKILDTYMQSALKDIHMSPFLAKVHELIETNLPDPVTGKETWSLKDHKEGLYTELRRWNDFLATGTNASIPDKPRMILNTLNKNIAYATLSGLIRSAGIQLSTLVNTQQALGPLNTFNAVVANLADHVSGGHRREFALANSEILSSRKFVEAYNELTAAVIGRRPRDFFHAIRTGDFGSIQAAVGRPGFKLMELFDMEAAVMSWNGAYKQAKGKMGYTHKDSVRFADDLVVRTQGSTMPGDLTGIQRNALGKLFTQFQTFLINDFNFLRNEVLSKQRTGGSGGGQIPPGGVASGTGDWSKGGKPSTFKLIGNIIQLLAATQLVNELYKLMHIQPAQPDPVEDFRRGSAAGHGPAGLAWDLAVGQIERVPIIGGALRYGSGVTGPATEAVRDLTRAARNDPMTRNPYEEMLRDAGIPEPEITSKVADPATRLLGIPYTRQVSKTLLGQKRGASVYDSLMGWQGTEGTERERRETRERRSRSERRR